VTLPYEFIQNISEGSFGRVYMARDPQSGGVVAIKELKQLDPASLRQFERELRLLREQIDNRFVVDVLDFDLNRVPPFIVMEYCDGGSLRAWVQNRQPWLVVAEALGHVAEGLAGIHKAGGFHRDIKPDNLLLAHVNDQGLMVKVADFGLARVPRGTGTMTYSLAGTRGYIAPEVLMGADFHSGADIYSLGMVSVELLTGGLDPIAIDSSVAPDGLKNLTRAMISPMAASRPNIQRVAQLLTNIISPPRTPVTSQPAPPPTPTPRLQNSGAEVAVAVGIGAALLAAIGGLAYLAANSPEWDGQVQRYRGKDGRFRS
jgi:serine/threonine protein kinase